MPWHGAAGYWWSLNHLYLGIDERIVSDNDIGWLRIGRHGPSGSGYTERSGEA